MAIPLIVFFVLDVPSFCHCHARMTFFTTSARKGTASMIRRARSPSQPDVSEVPSPDQEWGLDRIRTADDDTHHNPLFARRDSDEGVGTQAQAQAHAQAHASDRNSGRGSGGAAHAMSGQDVSVEAKVDLAALARSMCAAEPPLTADRTHRLQTYKNVFVASAAVDWLLARDDVPCVSRAGAVTLGQALQAAGHIRHCVNEQRFADAKLFFNFSNAFTVEVKLAATHATARAAHLGAAGLLRSTAAGKPPARKFKPKPAV